MKHAGAELSARVLPRAPLHPPLEGEGRRRGAAPAPGWGGSLREKTHPTPPLASLASTLPLQGRVSEHAARSFRHLALHKRKANAPPPGFSRGAGCPCPSSAPFKK